MWPNVAILYVDILTEKPYFSLHTFHCTHYISASFKECPAVPGCATGASVLMERSCFLIFIYLEIFAVFN